jgi:hypothetical protein
MSCIPPAGGIQDIVRSSTILTAVRVELQQAEYMALILLLWKMIQRSHCRKELVDPKVIFAEFLYETEIEYYIFSL